MSRLPPPPPAAPPPVAGWSRVSRPPQPPAPAVLQAQLRRTEDVVAVHRATRLVRVFTAKGSHPQRWNTFRYTGPLPHARFDAQQPADDGSPVQDHENGVLYF